MKTLLFSLLLITITTFSYAQRKKFKPFQLYTGMGASIPNGGGGGILFDVEPAYRIMDEISVGLRLESAIMARVVGDEVTGATALASYTLNGKYYFTNGTFRPYVGIGMGLYRLGGVSVQNSSSSSDQVNVADETKFGFYPRIGFDLGHFNVNIDYNFMGKTTYTTLGSNEKSSINNNYLGIRIGAFFWGGRK